MAFFRLEPPENGYWQAAMIASTLVRVMSGERKPIEDFMPQTSRAVADRQADLQGIAMMQRLAAISKAKGRV